MIQVLAVGVMFFAGPDPPDARRLLLDCEKQFLRIESIKGTVRTRSLVHRGTADGGAVSERRSDFVYSRFDRIRFENTAPLEHTVIWNGETLWIWSPRENAAVEEPASAIPAASRAMLSVEPGFGLDMLGSIPLDAYSASVRGDVVTLTPIDKKVPRATMQLVVDAERRLVTRIVLLDGDTILSDVRMTKPVEAKPGIWFATQVEARQLLDDGSTLEELRIYERLSFDVPVDASRFEFAIPEGASRVSIESFPR